MEKYWTLGPGQGRYKMSLEYFTVSERKKGLKKKKEKKREDGAMRKGHRATLEGTVVRAGTI